MEKVKALLKKMSTFASGNIFITIAVQIVIGVLIFAYGCESQVQSVARPGEKVTRDELAVEVDTFLALAEIRYKQLDQKDQLKNALLEYALLFAESNTVNPIGVVTTIASILGVGAIADNVTKRRREAKHLTTYVADVKKKEGLDNA